MITNKGDKPLMRERVGIRDGLEALYRALEKEERWCLAKLNVLLCKNIDEYNCVKYWKLGYLVL